MITSLALQEPLKKDEKGKKEKRHDLNSLKYKQKRGAGPEGVWFWNVFVCFWKKRAHTSWIDDTSLAWRSVNKNKNNSRITSQRKSKERRKVEWGGVVTGRGERQRRALAISPPHAQKALLLLFLFSHFHFQEALCFIYTYLLTNLLEKQQLMLPQPFYPMDYRHQNIKTNDHYRGLFIK
jgi:hypothetical protein